jgi:hypothetical protein
MSLLHEAINEKKFDVRMLERNLVRNAVTDKEVKTFIEQLPDDSENASFVSLDEISEQKK